MAEPSKSSQLSPVAMQQVQIEDDFWSPKIRTWRAVTIPDCFAKFEKDGALTNFDKIRDGTGGEHGGPPWYDGLIYEMIRGSADFLATKRDPALEAQLDGYIDRIAAAAAKDPDGYLNTYTQLKEPTHRWGLNGGDDNHQHDVYNASALIEAGVHYYRATGKTTLLQVGVKLANHMADLMGPPPKRNIVPGHSLGEEALVNLYLLFREQPQLKSQMGVPVDEPRYLKLAEFWLENRGNHDGRKSYGTYGQDHEPVLKQQTIEGHAVRATLLCAGLVAAAQVNGRADYLAAAQRLWTNLVERRMYVIGGLGAIAGHEGFGPDYELPNNGYLETCAAIGAAFFHRNLNLATGDAGYADELERVLYNGVLSGVSLKGDSYFYENPLEATQKRTRWSWHGCPCCPPMFLKLMGALPGYIYAQNSDGVYVNLFIGSRASLMLNGKPVEFRQTTRYPWDGTVQITIESDPRSKFALNLRLPVWCGAPQIKVNGRVLKEVEKIRGYARIEREWRKGDRVELSLPMPVQRLHAHPKVEADIGRVALQRGPIVYCLEGVDNDGQVRNLVLPPGNELTAEHRKDFLGGVTVLRGRAQGLYRADWPNVAYLPATQMPGVSDVPLLAIPYYANANRQPADLMVWLAETPLKAEPQARPTTASAQEAAITVNADQVLHRVAPYLTGACLEDVNHEVYGGIDSQMVFGESFAEPAAQLPLKGFKTFGGRWTLDDSGALQAVGSGGAKAVWDGPAFAEGEVSVDVRLLEAAGGNGGLILKVNDAGNGADVFTGYEVSLERPGFLVLGRHRQNWEPLRRVPCDVPVNEWIKLAVRLGTNSLEVTVNGKPITCFEDLEHPLAAGSVGLRIWQHEVCFRNLVIASGAAPQQIPFQYEDRQSPDGPCQRPVARDPTRRRCRFVHAGIQGCALRSAEPANQFCPRFGRDGH
ncbi:MAG: glycoside hydrolase family 127 protein [Verrucomicrobiota bacterium]